MINYNRTRLFLVKKKAFVLWSLFYTVYLVAMPAFADFLGIEITKDHHYGTNPNYIAIGLLVIYLVPSFIFLKNSDPYRVKKIIFSIAVSLFWMISIVCFLSEKEMNLRLLILYGSTPTTFAGSLAIADFFCMTFEPPKNLTVAVTLEITALKSDTVRTVRDMH